MNRVPVLTSYCRIQVYTSCQTVSLWQLDLLLLGITVVATETYLPLTLDSQMVDAPDGEVQIHQSDLWNPSLHRDDVDINHERKLKSCEALVEHCTKNGPSDRFARILMPRRFH